MSRTKSPTPRVIFVRHGQTEWSKTGQHTSITDLPLTDFGIKQMRSTGKHLIGSGPYQLVKPAHARHFFVSPRLRATRSAELLLESLSEPEQAAIKVEQLHDLQEWKYGDYEGLLTSQIIELRKLRGLDQDFGAGEKWSIWSHGCENGENHAQVTDRVDRVIDKIKQVHRQAFDRDEPCDVVVVAHGHILRCLVARWLGKDLSTDPQFILAAGGVGVLSYQHHNINEPSLALSGAFIAPLDPESS